VTACQGKKLFISKKIKEIRAALHISQRRLAKLLGYSKSYIANVESGRTTPSSRLLEALQRVCGVSLDWLLAENRILDMINYDKEWKRPYIIYLFAFTEDGLFLIERMVTNLFAERKVLIVDALGVGTRRQLLQKIMRTEGRFPELWREFLRLLTHNEVILIIKNMSLSKIPGHADFIKKIFDIIYTTWRHAEKESGGSKTKKRGSSFILIDYPSFLEKHMQNFGHLVVAVYARPSFIGWEK